MTEHDPLFDHLRRQLHDYGPTPPESVWAGIQQQQQRPTPRAPQPWRLPALLVLLVLTLTFTARYWRPTFDPAVRVATSRAAQPAGPGLSRSNAKPSQRSAPTSRATSPTQLPGRATQPGTEAEDLATGPSALGPNTASVAVVKACQKRTAVLQSVASAPLATSRRRAKGLLVLAPAKARRTTEWQPPQAKPSTNLPKPDAMAELAGPGGTLMRAAGAATNSSYRRPLASADDFRPLAFRTVLLRLPARPPAGPALPPIKQQPEAEQLPRLPANWSVQMLAGPGLTYRLLGRSATRLQNLERPATGLSGQLTVAYAFSPRLTLAAGLGYAQYATTLRYQLARRRADSLVAVVDFRDQYNFLMVPVQARLEMGGNHRWRYGVLGGVELAVLMRTRTTEGSPCYCRQQVWQGSAPGSDSTFRRLSLALTAGAFASYQFRPGQWLTVQPQAQLFASPINAAGSASRRPWSLGLQVGYRWELAPRRR